MKTRDFLIVTSILLASVAFRCYWASQKDGMNCDEVLSFTLCNYNDPTWSYQLLGTMSGAEVKKQVMINDPTVLGCISDIWHMYISTRDQPHTNFYYSLLRLSIIGFDSVDIRDINNRAIALNIIFYLIEFLFFFRLLKLYFNDRNFLLYGGLFCFSLMPALISDTLLNRDYQIQEMAYVIMAYWVTIVIRKLRDNNFAFDKRNFMITTATLSLALFTGYFAVFFVAFVGLFFLKELYDTKSVQKGLPFFIGTVGASLLVCSLLYHSYYMGFMGDGRIKEMVFGEGALLRMYGAIAIYIQKLNKTVLWWPVALILIIAAITDYKNIKRIPWIVLPAVCYTLFVFLIAPFKEIRYIVGAIPFIILVIPFFVGMIKNTVVCKSVIIIISLFYLIMPCYENNIENLAKDNKLKELLSYNDDITIVQSDGAWQITSLIPYLEDNKKYNITNRIPIEQHPGSIIAFDHTVGDYACIDNDNNYEPIGNHGFFVFYKIK